MKPWYGVIVLLLIAGGYGLYKIGTAPVPGQKMPDMGQEHVSPAQVLETKYNSNPPTSGPHLPTWVKPGVYDTPQSEGELIHSLEHGYVIISYNCGVHLKSQKSKVKSQNIISKFKSLIPLTLAHEDEGSSSALLGDPTIATGSAIIDTPACTTLVKQLSDVAQKKKLFKLIVVPRPQLDTTIALTAWTYIDKFDSFDQMRIEKFIDYHRDHGPEKTKE